MQCTRMMRAGIAALIGVGLAAASAEAQEERTFLRDTLSTLGIMEKAKPPIEYRERPPLVVPPKLELVQPQQRAAVRPGAWPIDRSTLPPTEAELAAEQAERETLARGRIDDTHPPTVGRSKGAGGLQSILNEVQAQRDASGSTRKRQTGVGPEVDSMHIQVPEDAEIEKGKVKLATGAEPERRRLADPPKGYRAPPKVDRVVQPAEPAFDPWDPLGLFKRRD